MRLLQRPPETPSLETWLSRDVPHERELASELFTRLGREKSLEALLALHNLEETKRIKRRCLMRRTRGLMLGLVGVTTLFGILWPYLIETIYGILFAAVLAVVSVPVGVAGVLFGYGLKVKASRRQKNVITALFAYNDSPLIADALCRAIAYYDDPDRWEVFANLMRVLPLLPDEPKALTGDARKWLRNRLVVMERRPATDTSNRERTRYADFEIAVVRYFARTRDRDALPAIRRVAEAKPFSEDGKRVQDAARIALSAFD